jgi:hypothetical protein
MVELRERYSDPLLTLLTALLLLMMFVVAPLQAAGILVFQAFGVVVAIIASEYPVVVCSALTDHGRFPARSRRGSTARASRAYDTPRRHP